MTENESPVSSPTDWVSDHVRRYVESDGADGHMMNGVKCLLLTTRGHKSGQLRRTPLVYGHDGDRFVMVKQSERQLELTVVLNFFEELKAKVGN